MEIRGRNIISGVLLLIVFVFIGCEEGEKMLPPSEGDNNNIIVVCSDHNWKETPVGDSLLSILSGEFPGLINVEPNFELTQVKIESFKKSFERYKNIIRIEFREEHVNAQAINEEDVWAKDQLVITLKARNLDEFQEMLSRNAAGLKYLFDSKRIVRLKANVKKNKNEAVSSALREQFKIDMNVPISFQIGKQENNFCYLFRTGKTSTESIMVYDLPYDTVSDFSAINALIKRDSITKEYISGPSDSSYMRAVPDYPFVFSEISLDEEYALETRGAWTMENATMGGTFVNYMAMQPNTGRLICIDGFVFAPADEKKSFMLNFESIAKSLKFIRE